MFKCQIHSIYTPFTLFLEVFVCSCMSIFVRTNLTFDLGNVDILQSEEHRLGLGLWVELDNVKMRMVKFKR